MRYRPKKEVDPKPPDQGKVLGLADLYPLAGLIGLASYLLMG